jgi:hypothetical protein
VSFTLKGSVARTRWSRRLKGRDDKETARRKAPAFTRRGVLARNGPESSKRKEGPTGAAVERHGRGTNRAGDVKGGKGVKLRIVSPEHSHRPSQQSVDGDDGPGGGALAELFLRNPLSSLSTSK